MKFKKYWILHIIYITLKLFATMVFKTIRSFFSPNINLEPEEDWGVLCPMTGQIADIIYGKGVMVGWAVMNENTGKIENV